MAMDGLYIDNDDLFEYEAQAVSPYRNSPTLLKLAALAAGYEKTALIPAGGDPSGGAPMDPSAGGAPPPDGAPPGGAPAPPPDPSAGGAAPPPAAGPDPAMIQAVTQAVMQQLGGGGMGAPGGGMGDMMGKPKKVDPAITDAKLYDIDKKVSLLCDHFQITIPATQTMGLPPDPMAAQAAAQDTQNVSTAMSGGMPQQPAGPTSGIQPMGEMDGSQGPLGKAASYGESWLNESPLTTAAYDEAPTMGSRFRQLMGV